MQPRRPVNTQEIHIMFDYEQMEQSNFQYSIWITKKQFFCFYKCINDGDSFYENVLPI